MGDFNLVSWVGHSLSVSAIFGAMVGFFPSVAALVALIWYIIQIYQSDPVQRYLRSRRLRKIAKLKLEMARLEALELVAHPAGRVDIPVAKEAAEELLRRARAEALLLIEAEKKDTKGV